MSNWKQPQIILNLDNMAGGEAGLTNTRMFLATAIELPPRTLLLKHASRSIHGYIYKTDKQTSPCPFSKVMFQL